MSTLITVVHFTTCVLLAIVVLLQSGKGAEISASFGGSSQTVFGSSGGANFFTRLTFALAGIFMLTSITLTVMSNRSKKSVFDGMPAAVSTESNVPAAAPPAGTAPAAQTAPAAPAAPAKP